MRYRLIEEDIARFKNDLLNKKVIPINFKRAEQIIGRPINAEVRECFYKLTGLSSSDKFSCRELKDIITRNLKDSYFQSNGADDKYHQYGKYKFLNGFIKFVKKAFDRMLSMLTSIMSMSLFTLSSPFVFNTIPAALFASLVFISLCFYIKYNKAENKGTSIMYEGIVDNVLMLINRKCQEAFDKIRPVWEWFFGDPDVIGDVYIRRRRQTLLVVVLLCVFAIIKYV